MIRLVGCALALIRCMLAFAALGLTQTALAAEQVDLLLVLSSDVSRSVDHPKFLLQREGYASAISDPQVLDAIKSGPHQRIAICFVEWSGFGAQKLVIDWTLIDGPAAARCWSCPGHSPTAPRSAAVSSSRPPSSSARRSKARAAPSTSRATAPTTRAAT